MSDDVTNEQVDAQRDAVIALRAQLEEEKQAAAVKQASNSNSIEMAQLKAEEDRLQAELDAVRAQNNPEVIEASAEAQIETILSGPEVPVTPVPDPVPGDNDSAENEED